MITIHNFARGVRGLRVMWQCEEMELPYQVETVSFPPSAGYLALHPLGSVPFLEDEHGVAINESVAMMLYLADKYGPTPLLPRADAAKYARVLQLTVFSEASIGGALNALMATHFVAPEGEKRSWTVNEQERRVERALGFVESMLGDQPFLAGSDLTLADIAVSTAFGMWEGALGKTLSDKLAAYRERQRARPAYQRAAARAKGTQA